MTGINQPSGTVSDNRLSDIYIERSAVATAQSEVAASREEHLMYVSMVLLVMSCVQSIGWMANAIKLLWIASVAALVIYNIGAAFGVYIASVALYAVLSYGGWGSPIERPDNYALIVVITGFCVRIVNGRLVPRWNATAGVTCAFIIYGLVQASTMGVLTRVAFAAYMRTFAFPMGMFLLIAYYGFSHRELRAFIRALLVLGAYMSLVSIAERTGLREFILPSWIAGPMPAFASNPSAASWVGSGRSIGLVMQAEYNALALSLIYCIAIFAMTFFKTGTRSAMTVASLCLAGVFCTFTRAAWVACALASVVLLWRASGTAAKTRAKRFAIVTLGAGAILALVLGSSSFMRERIGDSDNVVIRLNLWKTALVMTADHPLMGIGFNTFADKSEDYRNEMTLGALNIQHDIPVHNMLLGVLVELGSIGLVLYLSVMALMCRDTWKAAAYNWGRAGGIWVATFVAVFALQAQVVGTAEPTTNQIFFGIIGAITGMVTSRRNLPSTDGHAPRRAQAEA